MIAKMKTYAIVVLSVLGAIFYFIIKSKNGSIKELKYETEKALLDRKLGKLRDKSKLTEEKRREKMEDYNRLLANHPELKSKYNIE